MVIGAVGDVALLHPPSGGLFRKGWDDADLRIANLEAPLTTGGQPAAKLIRLQSPPEAAAWLRDDLGCSAVSLANNHIMDWGRPGLESTLTALEGARIGWAGAGMDLAAATTHRMLSVGGFNVAFLSWACTVPPGFRATERQAGMAAVRVRTSYAADPFVIDEQPGTPPWVHTEPWAEDVAVLERALRTARAASDFVVLSLHWGVPPQWRSAFQGPLAEYQEALAPRLAAAGADLVLGCHAHTVYGLQAFERRLVCFSLGNYIFHPLASHHQFPLDTPSRPYRAAELPENRDTFVGTFHLEKGPDDRLRIYQAAFFPAVLDDNWEARASDPETTKSIATRLRAFSAERATETELQEGGLLWSPMA